MYIKDKRESFQMYIAVLYVLLAGKFIKIHNLVAINKL